MAHNPAPEADPARQPAGGPGRYGALQWLGLFLVLSAVFALAYAQSPLYTSNQNQYFLRGAALSGMGDLADDWLVSTRDSTPLFSALTWLVFQFLHPSVFYLIYGLLLGLYLASLLSIFRTLHPDVPHRQLWLLAAVLIALHSAALRFLLGRIPGEHWEYLLEAGFAGQRLLGPVLQPSAFGVLLLASAAVYLRRRPLAAVLLAVLAAAIHPTYLLSAAALTMAFITGSWLEKRKLREPLLTGAAALLAVLPVLLYVLGAFSPSSAEATRQAQEVLVNFRIPQHAQIAQWFDATAVLKLLLLGGALLLARRTRLFPLLLVPSLVMVLLTGVQAATGSSQLALLFPWRLSTWLVPLSLLVAAGEALRWLHSRSSLLHQRPVPAAAAAGVLLLVLAGAAGFRIEKQRMEADPANPMMAFVREHADGDQVYMIPPRLQTFRLQTGEPAMVDFKSIPYRDVEVLQWYDRAKLAQNFYRSRVEDINCDLLGKAAERYGVTHVVLEQAQLGVGCSALEELYRDDSYGVYRLVFGTQP